MEIRIKPCSSLSLLIVYLLMFPNALMAKTYYVSPEGSDTSPGTKQSPFATIRKANQILQPGDTCYLREGVYYEVLRPHRTGIPGAEITILNYPGERPVISGAEVLSKPQKPDKNNIYSVPLDWTLGDENQVFINGEIMHEASWPSPGDEPFFKPNRAVATSGSEINLKAETIPGKNDDWVGARLWCAGGKSWICWTEEIIHYDAGSHTLTFKNPRKTWYTPEEGNYFVLRGTRIALDDPGEWLYDAKEKQLLFIPPKNVPQIEMIIEAKRRRDVMDLSNRAYIRIEGIHFRAGGIRTDEHSHHIVLINLTGRYVSHSYRRDISAEAGVLIKGRNNLVLNCDFGYSSASVLTVEGMDNRIINSFIHHGGYAGLWKGTVSLSGRRIVFSHNTVKHAGRDLVNTHGLMESLVQYNDVSDAGWLTKDLGMFYGHNTDFANTVFRYNYVHDNRAEHLNMGIYFDHLSNNAIVHHNIIWNVDWDPIRFNNPAYCNLVFNNTCANTGKITTFDHVDRDDLFESRFYNNVFNASPDLPEHVVLENNLILENPPFFNPNNNDYRLDTLVSGYGAYDSQQVTWSAGHDPKNPPRPLPEYVAPDIPWMNGIYNASFEFGTLEGWKKTGTSNATLVEGNWWGVDFSTGEFTPTGTSDFELQLGPGFDGVTQIIRGLNPETTYRLSAWMKVSSPSDKVILGVKNHGGEEVSSDCSSIEWKRISIEFATGSQETTAVIYVMKNTESNGNAWCDNLTLPLKPGNFNNVK